MNPLHSCVPIEDDVELWDVVIENTDNNENREQWAHIFHLKERTVAESFFKSDVKNDLHITLTFEGEKGYIE